MQPLALLKQWVRDKHHYFTKKPRTLFRNGGFGVSDQTARTGRFGGIFGVTMDLKDNLKTARAAH